MQGKLNLDEIDAKILLCLQENARIPFTELGRRVALSTPAVIERVRRLEENNVIVGYHAEVRPEKVGLTVRAFIKVSVAGDKLEKFATIAKKVPEILECHRVTGSESFILQAAVEDVAHLELVIDSLMPYVATNTAIVLGSPVPWAPVVPRMQDRLSKK